MKNRILVRIYSILIFIFKILKKDAMNLKIKKYRLIGYHIGDNCRIFSSLDVPEPFLITIGNNVTLSHNVDLISHDNSVIKITKGEYTDLFGKIHIGNNCFIGANTTVLPGVHIADDNIIGAGSVVTKSFDCHHKIIAGNPARIISDYDCFASKNRKMFFNCRGKNYLARKDLIMSNDQKILIK